MLSEQSVASLFVNPIIQVMSDSYQITHRVSDGTMDFDFHKEEKEPKMQGPALKLD